MRGHGAYFDMGIEGAESFCPKYLDKYRGVLNKGKRDILRGKYGFSLGHGQVEFKCLFYIPI